MKPKPGDTFPMCGHANVEENRLTHKGKVRCRACKRERDRRYYRALHPIKIRPPKPVAPRVVRLM